MKNVLFIVYSLLLPSNILSMGFIGNHSTSAATDTLACVSDSNYLCYCAARKLVEKIIVLANSYTQRGGPMIVLQQCDTFVPNKKQTLQGIFLQFKYGFPEAVCTPIGTWQFIKNHTCLRKADQLLLKDIYEQIFKEKYATDQECFLSLRKTFDHKLLHKRVESINEIVLPYAIFKAKDKYLALENKEKNKYIPEQEARMIWADCQKLYPIKYTINDKDAN